MEGNMDKRKIGKTLRRILPHICIICALVLIVFFVIDRMNENQAFLKNEFHKWVLFILSVASLIESVLYSSLQRRMAKAEYKKKEAAKAKAAAGKVRAK